MNLFPKVTDLLDQGSAILTKLADSNRADAEQKEKLAAILADPELREKLNRILGEVSFFGLDIVSRIQGTATPKAAPKPEPTPEPETRKSRRPQGDSDKAEELLDAIFGSVPSFEGFHAIDLGAVDPDSQLGKTLKNLIEKIEKSEKKNGDLPPF